MIRLGFLDDLPRQRKRKRVLFIWALALFGFCASLGVVALAPLSYIFKYLVLLIAFLCLIFSHVVMRRPEDGVPILMYHSVSDDPSWLPWAQNTSVSVSLFRAHLEMLKRAGFSVISNRDFVSKRLEKKPVPRRTVILHFDDGYLDNWVAVAPLLAQYNMHGTIFVSTDFVDPSQHLRPQMGEESSTALDWAGYANWPELIAMDKSAHIDVESHGVDHTRVFTSDQAITTLTPENWKHFAWLEWGRMGKDKSQWFRQDAPEFWDYGDTIYENDSALCGRTFADGQPETQKQFDARVSGVMQTSKKVLNNKIGRMPEIFCWPFNRSTLRAHEIALSHGYKATTNGTHQNRPQDDPARLARINVSARLAGIDSVWLDTLIMRGAIELFRGNHYWMFPVLGAGVLRKVLVKYTPPSQS